MRQVIPLPSLFLAAVLGAAVPAQAEEPPLQSQVDDLRARAAALEGQRKALFAQEVRSYLERTDPMRASQGSDDLTGVSVRARLTTVFLGTVNAEPGNRHSAHGDVDLDFDVFVDVDGDVDLNLVEARSR